MDRGQASGHPPEEITEAKAIPSRPEDFGGSTLPEGRDGVIIGGWRIESVKQSILNSAEVEKWGAELDAFRLPEMVFGNSSLELEHVATGTCIRFNAFDGLKEWKAAKLPPVKIPAAAAWEARERLSKEVILDYDYTFTTPYKGSLSSLKAQSEVTPPSYGDSSSSTSLPEPGVRWEVSTDSQIDWDLLKRKDPILFFDETILYEDELNDSGTCQLSVRTRVMPQCWFALLRFWLRVDGSLMRSYETRLFCRFLPSDDSKSQGCSAVVVREICQREDTFQNLAARGYPEEPSEYKFPDLVVQRLSVKHAESAVLKIARST